MNARKNALKKLIEAEYNGVVASMAKAVDIDASYLTRCLWPKSKNGAKEIGVAIRDKIAAKHPNWDIDLKIQKIPKETFSDDDELLSEFHKIKDPSIRREIIGYVRGIAAATLSNQAKKSRRNTSTNPPQKKAA